jgi:hypothetical protein
MGKMGENGLDGTDANETCKECHNATVVDAKATQFELSKHSYGEAAFEEAGSNTCGPCHLSESFKYVVANNTTSAFQKIGTATTFTNMYYSSTSTAYGEIGCFTCHSKLHTSYSIDDFLPLTTTAPVSMTFFGGAQTINLTQKDGESNLCVKCHQPRPFTRTFGDKNVIDYAALASSPTTTFFDGNNPTSTANINTIRPGYRTHTHYGTAGAIFAGVGKGGVEFGTGYSNSWHTTGASCQDCHTAPMTGKAGGHTFFAKGNFNGCNVTGCHTEATTGTIDSKTTTKYWQLTRDQVKTLLDNLAAKLTITGVDILNRNPDAETNLWASLTTNKYDGYLNIYDPLNNPDGPANNPSVFRNPSPGTLNGANNTSIWTQAQIDYNLTLPIITLTNAQMGAIINFQLCLRDFSMGIHNTSYTKTLLTNSIAAIP